MKNGKYGISDVAEMLGVSKSTVSRVINGNEGVGPELRKKVMDFINEHSCIDIRRYTKSFLCGFGIQYSENP
ncbi:LacI family DNA-binding transcriptional regulator [Blautia intestinalis]|uniref:LacI family DNA-binding transcriptional regulator n=1 Tax=Blautia intestinalis TaxID=2763028 RepID=UPI0022E8DDBA|nr:LacI family DNA-binding transcriptional regulator [Blautia intestinalis]